MPRMQLHLVFATHNLRGDCHVLGLRDFRYCSELRLCIGQLQSTMNWFDFADIMLTLNLCRKQHVAWKHLCSISSKAFYLETIAEIPWRLVLESHFGLCF